MSKPKVVVIDSLELRYSYQDLRSAVKAVGGELELLQCQSESEAIDRCRDAHFIVVHRYLMRRKLLEALLNCELIVRTGVGYDNIDLDAATEQRIVICNCPSYCTDEVADHTIAFMLMLNRRMLDLVSVVRTDNWRNAVNAVPLHTTHRIPGRVLAIIGFGRIGSAVARRAHGFGARIIANDPYVDFSELGYPYVEPMDLDPLLAEADIVSLHVPLTLETRGLINANKLQLMKPTSYLINTSRGPVVDEQALFETLAEKRIAAAAMDVMIQEPPAPDNPLLHLDNVIITPHFAAVSAESRADLAKEATGSVIAYLNGQWPVNVVNPSVVPKTTLAP